MTPPEWLHRILSWPLRKLAPWLGYEVPGIELDFVAQTYTGDRIWPFRRPVDEILTYSEGCKIGPGPDGLWVTEWERQN